LEQVIKGGNTNNLTKVIIEALENHASVSNADVVTKLISFEINGVNVFQGVCHSGVTQHKSKTNLLLIWKASTSAHCMNLIMQTWSQLPTTKHIEDLLQSLSFSFFSTTKNDTLNFLSL
jgi:hypothetical protein